MKNNRKNRKKMIMKFRKLIKSARYRVTQAMAARMIGTHNMWKSGKYDGGRTEPWRWVDRGPEPRTLFTIKMKKNRLHGAVD